MAHTALAFYRKPQSLSCLDFERPKSLDTVRELVSTSVAQIEIRLRNLEREFYGGRVCEDEIHHMLPLVHDVMIRYQVGHINSSISVDELIEKSPDKEDKFEGYPNPLTEVQDYNKKILSFIPGRFEGLLKDLNRVMECLHKYCRSYYKGTIRDPYIETAYHYDLKQIDYFNAAQEQMENIMQVASAYKSSNGLTKQLFGLIVNEIARKCDCGSLPFLLAFPECCQNIRGACAIIRRWIQEDSEYVGYIRKDVLELERKKEIQSKRVRDSQQGRVQVNHKLKSYKREVLDLEDQLEKVRSREESVEQDIKRMEDYIKFTEMDIEAKEGEKEALRKNAGTIFDFAEVNERCERLSSEIGKLRNYIPNVRRQIENLVSGKKFIIKKRDLLEVKKNQVRIFTQSTEAAGKECTQEERELERVEKCLAQLKEIYLYRTTPDMIKRIFYDMPTDGRRVKLQPIMSSVKGPKFVKAKSKKDSLDKAVSLVAKEIQNEWPKLYRRLPFHPPRGVATIEDDLDDIIKEQYRSKPEAQARSSLARWRRMHIRANLAELKAALLQMNRQDIVDLLDDGLDRTIDQRTIRRRVSVNDIGDDVMLRREKSRIGFGQKYKQVKDAAQRFMVMRGPHRFKTSRQSRSALSESENLGRRTPFVAGMGN